MTNVPIILLVEYRIKHKDGHYIHVYDIGKKMILPNGKAVIVCVLYDMTEEVKLKNVLIQESSYDVLTGLYNRRGLDKQLEKLFAEPEKLGYSLVNDCTDYHKLLKEADERMYQNKL